MVAWETLEHWCYFLGYGGLPYDVDPTRFSVDALFRDQAAALLDLLERGGPAEQEASIRAALRSWL